MKSNSNQSGCDVVDKNMLYLNVECKVKIHCNILGAMLSL
jgi:hypothetical protein